MNLEQVRELAAPIYLERDTDILLFSGGLWPPADDNLMELFSDRRLRNNLLFMLTTAGGWPSAAYRICRCLQNLYAKGRLILFVDDECTSAGTLICLGANELVMSDGACLGPIDTQLRNREEAGEMVSGLTPTQALATMKLESFNVFEYYFRKLRFDPRYQFSTRSSAQIAAEMPIGLFKPIYEQIDPMRLGENKRAIQLANDYGLRLATDNLKEATLARLVASYPSHEFVIDRWEADELFNRVNTPDEIEERLAEACETMVEEGRKADREGREAKVVFISPEPEGVSDDTKGGENNEQDTDRADTAGAGEGRSKDGTSGGDGTTISPDENHGQRSEASSAPSAVATQV